MTEDISWAVPRRGSYGVMVSSGDGIGFEEGECKGSNGEQGEGISDESEGNPLCEEKSGDGVKLNPLVLVRWMGGVLA